ncbi:hypothetical protein EUU23_06695 [Sphingorhabdus sp. IMCC26285]|uniref:Stability determinant domain-containing protein n=1 Tax=Sphingorhabdus profundilacus TaxID=2509718 RepID=A0A6I4LZ91_9SPHN|nr:hypothetical protein [Sphingorhabdus profundilacus]
MNLRSPIVSEFDTVEKAKAYEAWLHQKVADSLNEDSPAVSHDEAMGRARKIVETKRGAKTHMAR